MVKVVYNACYGGFGLSDKAKERYKELSGKKAVYDSEMDRTDPFLVQVVEEFGARAGGDYGKLKIADVPPGTHYRIDEYDGYESIETSDSIEWSIA